MAAKAATGYRVHFEYLETDGSVRTSPMTIPIGDLARHWQTPKLNHEILDSAGRPLVNGADDHYEGPWIREGKDYEGPLTEQELAWLRMLPGKSFNAHYRFTVSGGE